MAKKIVTVFLVILLVLMQVAAVSALTASEAKEDWRDAKELSKETQEKNQDAKIKYAGNKTVENNQEVIDTGKEVLHAALNEAEAWLIWKDLEADENQDVPDDLKDSIKEDVDANLAKIDSLRTEVDGIQTRFDLGVVFLKMIGNYFELLSDVARNSGNVWVYIADTHADKIESYELKLRDAANHKEDVLAKLDSAHLELETARKNIDNAELTYKEVKLPGTPLVKFAEGNNYLRAARANMIAANQNLNQAYRMLVN
ncbi:MAG: hypothetical protein ABH824_06805 [Nanoarchaeota archaeon]|nr:hypothetical protein [Nanoarchaeota archaeon]MBU1631695.1 hypothetical protein [Nanoarchaeota archaeon]MBU1876243.1 hypothetical protein [Nanoarchaeota archaeon]